ncbi:PilN domain-containing protein [Melaminivora suipulveris]|nr:PilN domain-containing protein [Melaminivora suipulveris]
MASLSSDARLFGVDLQDLWREVRMSWQHALGRAPLVWLRPAVPIVLLTAGGERVLWTGDEHRPAGEQGAAASGLMAVELPEDMVLRRSLSLPVMTAADRSSALELEARTHSPFARDDLVWGSRVGAPGGGVQQAELVLASRQQIAQHLAALQGHASIALPAPEDLEVWALSWALSAAQGLPIVLTGYGERRRRAVVQRQSVVNYALLATLAVLLLAMALTPTLQLRQRAIQAVQTFEKVTAQAAPAVHQREQLMRSVEQLNGLSEALATRIEPLRVLERLTRVLPDDTAVQIFKLQGTKVTLTGDTDNASTLLRLLGDQPGISDVKAPTAATRLPGAAKDSYVVEFNVDPQVFGGARVASTVTAPAAAAEPAAATAPTAPPPSASTSPQPAAASPAPPSAGGAPRAVFGGTRAAAPAPAPKDGRP